MELGLSEKDAKSLALDRSFTDVKSLTPALISQATGSSPEQARRTHEQIVSPDSHDITRRVRFRSARIIVSARLTSLMQTIESQMAVNGLIDVNKLLREEISEPSSEIPKDEFENEVQRAENDSDVVHAPLQDDICLDLFPEDPNNSIRKVRYLIGKKVEVPMSVIEGYHIDFKSEHQVRLTVAVTEISEEELKAVTEGLLECERIDANTAQSILDNLDLAKPHVAPPIEKKDIVIERFPMKTPRKRDPLDKHPDDLRWPSDHAGKSGKVMDRLCWDLLVVEFEGADRPREVIHESHCKVLPSSRANPKHRGGFIG